MAGKLLDTNAAIAYLSHDAAFQEYIAGQTNIFVPIIVIGELYYGAYHSSRVETNLSRAKKFADARKILLCDRGTADRYGQIKQALHRKGRPIPDNDIWIAAIAVQHRLILVTRDQHFKQVDDLQIEAR